MLAAQPFLIVALVFLSGASLLVSAFLAYRANRKIWAERLELMVPMAERKAPAAVSLTNQPQKRSWVWIELLTGPEVWPVKRSLRQRASIAGVGALAITVLLVLVTGIPIILGVLLWILLAPGLLAYLSRSDQKAAGKQFLEGLPEALDVLVRNLQVGLPLDHAIIKIASQTPQPVSGVFAEIAQLMRAGASLGDALETLALRIDLPDFAFFRAAVTIQSRTGGNFIEAAQHLAQIMRERQLAAMRARAASVQSRITAGVMIGLPILIVLGMVIIRPQYFAPLLTNQAGTNIIGYGILSLLAGIVLVGRYLKRFYSL